MYGALYGTTLDRSGDSTPAWKTPYQQAQEQLKEAALAAKVDTYLKGKAAESSTSLDRSGDSATPYVPTEDTGLYTAIEPNGWQSWLLPGAVLIVAAVIAKKVL